MDLLAWIVVGLIAGWLASQVMRGGGFGVIGDIIVGVVGAVIGGYLAGALLNMPNAVSGINITSIIVAFVGAMILIAGLRLISGRRALV
ncbi:MAG: GlsB/YeaQ/YmgE family stress response membrane protein [Anaerolineales bacterium]|nr:GlsB/YeaQ/YmgE family stress response membrane protein [Anaerolineales bacterium]